MVYRHVIRFRDKAFVVIDQCKKEMKREIADEINRVDGQYEYIDVDRVKRIRESLQHFEELEDLVKAYFDMELVKADILEKLEKQLEEKKIEEKK